MNCSLLYAEIVDLNRKYLALCLRASGQNDVEACLHLNIPLSFLKTLQAMSHDEVESLAKTPTLLVKPCINEKSLKVALNMASSCERALYVQSIGSEHGN